MEIRDLLNRELKITVKEHAHWDKHVQSKNFSKEMENRKVTKQK